jgi:hypothetical protein
MYEMPATVTESPTVSVSASNSLFRMLGYACLTHQPPQTDIARCDIWVD